MKSIQALGQVSLNGVSLIRKMWILEPPFLSKSTEFAWGSAGAGMPDALNQ